MLPIARPSTPRTHLYETISASNQRNLLDNIARNFDALTADHLNKTQKEYFPLRDKVRSLIDEYNPDTTNQGFIYNTKGEDIPLKFPGIVNYDVLESLLSMPLKEKRRISEEVHPIVMQMDDGARNALHEFQKDNIEVFTVQGLTGDESALNGSQGIRAKKPIPIYTLVDAWRGMRFTKEDTLDALKWDNLNTLYNFIGQHHNKYFAKISDSALDIRSLTMKANSAFYQPEKENIAGMNILYYTEDNIPARITAMVTTRPIEANEEIRYKYDYLRAARMKQQNRG